jgi:hypothetical protein
MGFGRATSPMVAPLKFYETNDSQGGLGQPAPTKVVKNKIEFNRWKFLPL